MLRKMLRRQRNAPRCFISADVIHPIVEVIDSSLIDNQVATGVAAQDLLKEHEKTGVSKNLSNQIVKKDSKKSLPSPHVENKSSATSLPAHSGVVKADEPPSFQADLDVSDDSWDTGLDQLSIGN
jgi:hypothetical protein